MEDFNDGVDGKQASRLRTVNSEQFQTLVKMHLSFELDRHTEDFESPGNAAISPSCYCFSQTLNSVWREAKHLMSSPSSSLTYARSNEALLSACNDCIIEKAKLKKWGLPSFSKKAKSTMNVQKGNESAALTQVGINQVKRLIKYLSQEQCITQEGIFRRTGKLTRQQDLKNALYHGLPLDLSEGTFSVHDCASVLKGFLADLPEPLLTDLHYPVHCQIAELCSNETSANDARLLRALQLLLLLLPPLNRILLKHVLDLLNKTASFEANNKMNCGTLATLFTPHLMCPRKLSPEALHVNSQNLSCIVAFMIKNGLELFEIPPKLAMDIRAYWVEQERKLLSPRKSDLNESISDTTGTAHTVFSFVDHQLTAQATASQDTQAALAQLYAYIQTMPESAKKRKLVKQFNKENGQGTPRNVKNIRTKSLGDSIKKHIFQKKLLGHKKITDLKLGCNFSRSTSEENLLSAPLDKPRLPPKGTLSKSEDELSTDSFSVLEAENIFKIKHMSSSTGSLNTPPLSIYKAANARLLNFESIDEEHSHSVTSSEINLSEMEDHMKSHRTSSSEKTRPFSNVSVSNHVRLSRHCSEPPNMYSSQPSLDGVNANELVRQQSDPGIPMSKRPNIEVVFTRRSSTSSLGSQYSISDKDSPELNKISGQSDKETNAAGKMSSSPIKTILRNVFTASTPSNLLRRSLAANECMLTPITDTDTSMSPITQSATKLSKAMQENIMTPRSRKPVVMSSVTNICNLSTLHNDSVHCPPSTLFRGFNTDLMLRKGCTSIIEESPICSDTCDDEVHIQNKENVRADLQSNQNFVVSTENDNPSNVKKSSSITSTFKEYLLSRSVLTASPVDLSFASRTGDFEPSESDLNILNEDALSDSLLNCLDGNNPGSDTSGIASSSTNSTDNSAEKMEEVTSPRKRGTSLQRNDSKRAIKDKNTFSNSKNQALIHKQLSDSTLNSLKSNEVPPETAF